MKRKINSPLLSFLLVITAIFFAACGNGGETSPTSTPNQNTDNQENLNTSQTVAASVDTVIIKMMKFEPAYLLVNKGDTIVWINKDIVAHDVTEFHNKLWTSDTIARGESWKKVIDEGFVYFCSIHSTMKGKIAVSP